MPLTDNQKLDYHRDGYLIVRSVLHSDELKIVQDRFRTIVEGKVESHYEDRISSRGVSGCSGFGNKQTKPEQPPAEPGPHTSLHVRNGTQISPKGGLEFFEDAWKPVEDPMDAVVRMIVLRNDEVLKDYVRHPGILDIASELMSPNIKLYYDQVFAKAPYAGANRYHQDSVFWNFFASKNLVTAWIALDDATRENGCVRYLPGSHDFGLIDWEHIPFLLTEDLLAQEVFAEVKAGDVIFHNSLTFHCSGPNCTSSRRWGWALHYVAAETRYIGKPEDDEHLWKIGALEKPVGKNGFPLMRGREFPECV
ncbi:MAG: phytanoyl-CoA dioxygenase family protein [Planctomycetota bacterium]|nr:phytanoyl-CoA dioxygenase family protein [Planctomycetota bacterium]MDA1141434.1 phytanoyl-CoA dioxygenase family protein [Planctomycetota bacterium]